MKALARLALAAALSLSASVATTAQPPVRLAPPQSLFREAVTLEQFTRGTLRFVLLHELGHGFVDVYELPVLGREEDAADRFAIFWLSPDGEGEDGLDAVGAMEWWMASAKMNPAARADLPWWDEHGMDEQRAFQIACLLYGRSPEDFGPLAARVGIPEDRRNSCRFEAAQNTLSWGKLLKGNVSTLHNLDSFFTSLTYQPPSPGTARAAALAKRVGALEEVREILRQMRWSETQNTITLVARDCGVSNAFWNPSRNELTLCYELVNQVVEVGYAAGFR